MIPPLPDFGDGEEWGRQFVRRMKLADAVEARYPAACWSHVVDWSLGLREKCDMDLTGERCKGTDCYCGKYTILYGPEPEPAP